MQLNVFCLSGYQLLVLYNFLQLIFEGIRGPGIEGDIAIDDVSIVEGECMKSDQPANSKWLFYTLGRANCFLRCRIEVSLKWMSCRRAKYHWVKSERLRVKSFPFCLHSRGRSPWCRKAPSAWGGVAIQGLQFWKLQMVPDGQTDKAILAKWLGGRNNMKLINRHVAIACGPSFIPPPPYLRYKSFNSITIRPLILPFSPFL